MGLTWQDIVGGTKKVGSWASALVPAATETFADTGTYLGNLASGTPIGDIIAGGGNTIGAISRGPANVGTAFGNAINAPNQLNPFRFIEPIVNSRFGGAVAGGANFIQDFLPFRNLAKATDSLRAGNYGSYWGNLGASGLSVVGPGARVAQSTGAIIPGVLKAGRALVRENRIAAPAFGGLAALGSLAGGGTAAATQTPQLRPTSMSADAAERRAIAAQQQQPQQNAAMQRIAAQQRAENLARLAGTQRAADIVTGVRPVDVGATAAERAAMRAAREANVSGVGGPTGDMMAEYEQYLRQAQEDYERRMADIAEARAVAEEDYRLGTRRSRRGTAGRSANLSALLAAMGLDLSPAASEGGLSYEAQRGARDLAGQERSRMQARTGATRGEAEADAERKRTIATLNRSLMTGPAAAAGNAGVPRF